MEHTRRNFLGKLALGMGTVWLYPQVVSGQTQKNKEEPLPAEAVRDFVGKSHTDITVVKELVEKYPKLVRSAWDWKKGDFETGLGAAGHVGNHEIFNYLLEKGSVVDLFAIAFMGKMEIIEPFITAFPQHLKMQGPHGFTLFHFAKEGGKQATEVKEFLESKGLNESKIPLF